MMRLLERDNDGEFILKDFGDDVPQYAILSHTWEAEEVTFRDLMDGAGKSKAGYDKILFCGRQARHDGLEYFWVDTCCIDKSNNTELAEAINSMFRWYRDAAKCYVYLSDVLITEREASDQVSGLPWESAFRASRWFTRGWTLQELLAPVSVEFFSQEGRLLGNKRDLVRQVHEITGIPISALQGAPLSQFGVEERLLWAENRQTTRKEDKAYSLLGIFDIYMPLIYGEGSDNALMRLQEQIDKPSKGLDRLPFATEAAFNSYQRQHSPSCLPNTRVELLRDIYSWADGQDERCIFWLNGLAGTGKSTIARTVARRYFDEKRLGASFFFCKGGGDVGHARQFFTTLAVQLAQNVPQIKRFISNVVTEQIDITNQSLHDQWRQLVLRPLSRLNSSSSPPLYVLIIDALDECDSEDDIGMILQLLTEVRSLKTVRIRVFLTSRPESPIRLGFHQMSKTEHRDFVLNNISRSIVDHDIRSFLEYNLKLIGGENAQDAGWPGSEVIETLVQSASGLFIWAATACLFVREGLFADERLPKLLQGGASSASTPEEHLNGIYITVLQNSIQASFSQQDTDQFSDMIREVLGSVVTLFSPLSVESLSRLLVTSKQRIGCVLKDLHAILDIPNDHTRPLHLHHPSFRDFLLDKNRCRDLNFWVDEKQAHQALARSCIEILSISLKQNICGLEAPGVLTTNIEIGQVEEYLPAELQYACLYWVHHLKKSSSQLYDQVHQFLRDHLLHWLEALGWMRKTTEGILAIFSLEALIPADKNPNLYAFVRDAKRFALYNRSVIEQAPLQLYSSALVFAPSKSIVRRQFEKSIPPWIQRISKVQADWSATLQTLEGHSDSVTSVAFSLDGKQVVSGSDDSTVRLWDAATGAALQTLEGHSSSVHSVAFSPDGKQVVSGSNDKTVRLWDTVTGAALQMLEGHSSRVKSIAFSLDGKQVVSGSYDKTVRLWDTITGAVLHTLEGHSSWVSCVALSPDGKQVVSGSYDKTVRLWDAVKGAALHTLEGHTNWVNSVAFSPDGKQVVSASNDSRVRHWDAVTGAALKTLARHTGAVNSVAFSPDGKQVVSCGTTVMLWDAVTGAALQMLEGHLTWVNSVAFSPDGKQVVSGSGDKTIRLWDVVLGATLQTLEGHSSRVTSVAFSPDGKQIVSGSYDSTVRLWDAGTGAALQILRGHSCSVISVSFSPDGKQVVSASASRDKTVQLWNAVTGAVLKTLVGHSGLVKSVDFSPDGKQVVLELHYNIVQVWDAVTGAALQTIEDYSGSVNSVAFSQLYKVEPDLFTANDWVVDRDKNILWLPPDYRASSEAIWNKVLVLGHSSGKISILSFKEI